MTLVNQNRPGTASVYTNSAGPKLRDDIFPYSHIGSFLWLSNDKMWIIIWALRMYGHQFWSTYRSQVPRWATMKPLWAVKKSDIRQGHKPRPQRRRRHVRVCVCSVNAIKGQRPRNILTHVLYLERDIADIGSQSPDGGLGVLLFFFPARPQPPLRNGSREAFRGEARSREWRDLTSPHAYVPRRPFPDVSAQLWNH